MASLGQGKKYISIINTEISQVKPTPPTPGFISRAEKPPLFRLLPVISQKIQELEMLEKKSRFQKDATESEERNESRTSQ